MNEFVRETKKKGVTVIYVGCNQGVNKNGRAVECKGWAEAFIVT